MAEVLSAGGDRWKQVKESLPSMEGWVYDTPKKGALSRPREKRFVRLVHGKLYYYTDPLRDSDWSLAVRDTHVGRGNGRQSVQVSSLRRTVTFYTKTADEQKRWLYALEKCSRWKLHDFYELGSVVGNQQTSKVQTCTHLGTGAEVAVKTVPRADRPEEFVYNEMAIISLSLHPNVIYAVDILESADNVYLIQEYMRGGSLYDFISDMGRFTEQRARNAIRDLLGGVKAMHDKDIVHRDLKPENILCEYQRWPPKLKIADFGLAGFVTRNGYLKVANHFIGTVGYAAPEQYDLPAKRVGKAVDMWAIGAILWNMITATMPFPAEKREDIIEMTMRAEYKFKRPFWKGVSKEVMNFIERCFERNFRHRMTVEEALEHEWMLVEDDPLEEELEKDVIRDDVGEQKHVADDDAGVQNDVVGDQLPEKNQPQAEPQEPSPISEKVDFPDLVDSRHIEEHEDEALQDNVSVSVSGTEVDDEMNTADDDLAKGERRVDSPVTTEDDEFLDAK